MRAGRGDARVLEALDLAAHRVVFAHDLLQRFIADKAKLVPDGRKALHRMQFEQERILREDGNIVYVCEGQNLQKLKKKELRLHGQLRK